jgi:hypothetical protein
MAIVSNVGGGNLILSSIPSGIQSIASGAAVGDILTIPAVTGKVARLLYLAETAGAGVPNITITTSQGAVVSNLTLGGGNGADTTITGRFYIGAATSATTSNPPIQYIESKTSIVVSKGVAATAATIYYMFCYMDKV